MKKHIKKASITIELSLIMPGIMAAIILVIFMSFYSHDTCLIEKDCYMSALRLSEAELSSQEILSEESDGKLMDMLLGKWTINKYIKQDTYKVTVYIEGTMNNGNGSVWGYINNLLFSYNTSSEVVRINEVDFIRDYRNEF